MNARAKLYWLVLLLCLAAYCWLAFSHFDIDSRTVCPMKIIAGVPCPSCGTTRSVQQILHGHMVEAALINPFGFIAIAFLIVAPLWIFVDLIRNASSFLFVFQHAEKILQRQTVYIPLIMLCLLNWYWNIMKGL